MSVDFWANAPACNVLSSETVAHKVVIAHINNVRHSLLL